MSNTFIEINGKSVLINENTVCTIRKILKEDVVFLIADVEEYSYYPVTLLKDIAEIINELLLYLQGHKMYDNYYTSYFISDKTRQEIEHKIHQKDKFQYDKLVQDFGEKNVEGLEETPFHIYTKKLEVIDGKLFVYYSCKLDILFGYEFDSNFEIADIDTCILPDMIRLKNDISETINTYNKKFIKSKKKEQKLSELQEKFNLCLNELIENNNRISCIKEEQEKILSIMNSDFLDDIVFVIQSENNIHFFFEKECSFDLVEKLKYITQIQKSMQ